MPNRTVTASSAGGPIERGLQIGLCAQIVMMRDRESRVVCIDPCALPMSEAGRQEMDLRHGATFWLPVLVCGPYHWSPEKLRRVGFPFGEPLGADRPTAEKMGNSG